MTAWTPRDLSPRGPVYLAIADALARDLEEGLLAPGERLPTHRALARDLGVNVVTITRAYAEAARRGLVDGEVGRGTFVSRRDVSTGSHMPLAPARERIDFHFNLPAPGDGPEVSAGASDLLAELAGEGFDPLRAAYVPAGERGHREAGSAWMERAGLAVDAERVLLTSGGQHAMSVAFTTLTSPGDTVLTEELTYPGMKALAGLLHLRTLPVAMDAEGILPAALETACRKSNPKVLYCMPTLQNPTGIVWSEERRHAVLEITRRYGVRVLEDDTTGFLAEDAPPPLAASAPEEVVYLISTSKSLGAGLRVGFLAVPEGPEREAMYDRLVANLAALSWMTPPLMAELFTRLVASGRADEIVAGRRREVAERRALFDAALPGFATETHPSSSFVWAGLPDPWRSADFVEEARRAGVGLTSAESFAVGRAHAPHAVRVCIGTPERRADVEEGLALLAGIAERARPLCRSFV